MQNLRLERDRDQERRGFGLGGNKIKGRDLNVWPWIFPCFLEELDVKVSTTDPAPHRRGAFKLGRRSMSLPFEEVLAVAQGDFNLLLVCIVDDVAAHLCPVAHDSAPSGRVQKVQTPASTLNRQVVNLFRIARRKRAQ